MRRQLPQPREPLGFERVFTRQEADLLCAGFKPRDMDDRWSLRYDAPWLYVARSWTGFVVFGLELEVTDTSAAVQSSWVSRDPEQYKSTDVVEDRERLGKVLDLLLANIEAAKKAG